MSKNELKELLEKETKEPIKNLTNKDVRNLVEEYIIFKEGDESLSYNLFTRYSLQQCIDFIKEIMIKDRDIDSNIEYFLELLELFE